MNLTLQNRMSGKCRFLNIFAFLLGMSFTTFAQSKISGKVTDQAGNPIFGVAVIVKTTTNGTITDGNGNFTLSNVANGATLVASFVGFGKKEIPATNGQTVVLSESAELDEIIVTADKTARDIQKTAISMTAIKGATLKENGLTSIDQVLRDVPNVVVQGAARGFVVAMRGIGSDLPPGMGESSISTNYDGIYNFRAEAGTLGLYDIERVEALRGPQATLYGRNATGGVVNFISKDASNNLEGYGTVERGTHNLLRMEGAVNVPLSKNLSLRTSFANINRDGYLTNGQNDAVGSGLRTKLKFTPNENVIIKVNYEFNKLGGKGVGFTPYATYVKGGDSTLANPTTRNQQNWYRSNKVWADMSFNLGAGVLTVIPAYQHAQGEVWGDNGRGLSNSKDPKDAYQKSFETRYGSKADAKISWVLGYYYYSLENNNEGVGGGPFVTTDKTNSSSFFGQTTIPLGDKFKVIAGLRYATDTKSYNNPGVKPVSQQKSWNALDYKIGAESNLSENSMAYATFATGHRAGGFNTFPFAPVSAFDPEFLKSYELGIKNKLLNNKMMLNAALFYYDYKGFQVADFFFTPTGPLLQLSNHNVINKGLEIETKYLLSKTTNLKLNATFLNSTYNEQFDLHGGPADGPAPKKMNGVTLPHAPKTTINIGIYHTFMAANGLKITPNVNLRNLSEQYVAPFPGTSQYQKAYTMVDLSLRFASPNSRVSLNTYVRNASNEVVKMAFFGDSVIAGNPRQAGIALTANF